MTTSDSATVHVVAYALWPTSPANDALANANPWAQALQALPQKPSLQTIGRAAVQHALTMPANSPCGAHEWALAQALGWQVSPDQLPLAAWQAAQSGLACDADHGWAFIDLVHCEFNQGRVRISQPQDLSDDDSLAFMHAMQAFFLEDGIHLCPLSPGRFLAHARVFQALPCVSLERACLQDIHALHDVEQLSEQTSAQRLLRRLQNEMQMLLYTHDLNADRSPAINSFWVSGCGALPARTLTGVQVHTALRESFLQQHPPAWAAAWEELAHTLIAPALQQGDSLVLCGTDRCLTLTANSPSLWQQFLQKIRPQSWVKLLS